jgi:uncharacterized membrane-anchored protein
MSTLQRASAGLLVWVLAALPLAAQETPTTDPFEAIPWQLGGTGDLGSESRVQVPDDCRFTGATGTRQFLELTQNPTAGNERGTVICGLTADGNGIPWFVIFSYGDIGHVKDDERDKLNADDILESLRAGNAEGNKTRESRGWEPLSIDGWERPPYYDEKTNNLTWATIVSTPTEGSSINHSVRLLGREGVMNVDLVTSREHFAAVLPTFDQMVTGFGFKSGHTYGEWREGDKLAEYGLTALVAGGAGVLAVKSGILAKFWKLIVAGAVAVAAFFKKLFGKQKPADTPSQA